MNQLSPIVVSLEQLSETLFYDSSSLYQSFVEYLHNKTSGEVCYLSLYNHSRDEFDQCYCSNISNRTDNSGSVVAASPAIEALWKTSLNTRQSVIKNNLQGDRKAIGVCILEGMRHHALTPLFGRTTEVVGLLGLASRSQPFSHTDTHKLQYHTNTAWELVCEKSIELDEKSQLSMDKFNASSTQEVLVNLIGAISKALELRDAYTSHHMRNVSVVAKTVGEAMGLNSHRLIGLEIGSLIHDIGKIALPSEILNKPGTLSRAEYDLLKTHTTMGSLMFDSVSLPWSIREMILQHHERQDGSGYPNGRRGHEICLEAKIIAIADTFDAMSVDRPYRYAPGPEKAISVIKEDRGTKFDPYIVDAFLHCYAQNPSFSGIYR